MIRAFVADIVEKLSWRAYLLLVLTGVTSLFEGIAVALLLPLLHETGIAGAHTIGGSIAGFVEHAAGLAGLDVTVTTVVVAIVAVVVIQVTVFVLTQYVSGRAQARYISLLLNGQFSNLITAKWSLFRRHSFTEAANSLTGDILHKTGDAFIHLTHLVSGLCFTAVYATLALILDWSITLIMAALGLGILAAMSPLSRSGKTVGDRLVSIDRTLTSLISNYVLGIKVVKIFGLEDRVGKDFARSAHEREKSYFHYIFDPGLSRAVIELFAPLFLIAALLLGTQYLARDTLTVLVVMAIFARVYPRLSTMQQAHHSLRILLPAFQSARNLHDEAASLHEGADSPAAPAPVALTGPVAIEIAGLSAGYGDSPAIRDLSVSIAPGTIVAITGPSGSGKTTLIDTILGLLEPAAGKVLVNGEPLAAFPRAEWRRHIAYVDQDSTLFRDTIANNIRVGDHGLTEAEIVKAARMANAHDFICSNPMGYEYLIGDAGSGLSGGERQRIALARAFARKPKLLLLDEATSALDVSAESHVLNALVELRKTTTIIIATHRERPLECASQIIRLEKQRLS